MAFNIASIQSGPREAPTKMLIYGPHGVGKALAHGTPVLTPDGFVSVESIAMGDLVIAGDGTPTKVIGVYQQPKKQLYRVTFDDHSFVDCCGEHLWKVYSLLDRREQRDGTVISTERMIQTLYAGRKFRTLNYSIPMVSPVQFKAKSYFADPYVIGAWLGDGAKGAPVICKPYPEFQDEIRKIYPASSRENGKGLYIADLRQPLIDYGLLNLGSHERFIPHDLKYNSEEVRTSLLQGLFDTDGYTSINGTVIYTTTSPMLRDDVMFLVQSLGGIATTYKKKASYVNDDGVRVICKDAFNVSISIADMSNIFRADLMKARRIKQYSLRKYRDYARFIKRIEPVGIGDSTCLRVEHPSMLFVTKDFIVTHNTTFASQAPSPIFLCTEDGLGMLETPAFPLISTVAEVEEAIGSLYSEDHEFKTVVLDSADWLDNMIQSEMRANYSDKELGWGHDARISTERWRGILDGFNALRSERKMRVIFIAHCEIKRFDPPDSDSYERYQPKLIPRASAIIQEWADMVLFCNAPTYVKTENVDGDKRRQKTKASCHGDRLLYTGEKPAYIAKNRYSLPDTLPFSWEALAHAMPVPL